MKNLLFILVSTLSGCFLFGQTISTEAPSMTNSSVTVTKNTLQFENRFEWARNEGSNSIILPYTLVRFGLNKHFELRASNLIQIDSFGKLQLQRPQIGVKYALFESGSSNTNIGVITHFTIPFIDSNNDPSFSGWNALALSHNLGEKHQLATNIIMNWNLGPSNSNPKSIFNYLTSLCYTYQPINNFSVFGEGYFSWTNYIYGPTDLQLSNGETSSVDFGMAYLLRDNIQLSYTFGAGMNRNNRFQSIGFDIAL